MFTDRSGNVIGDDNAAYDDAPDETADLPGELIPEVAPDAIDITGVEGDNTTPVASHTDHNDSTGVADHNDSTGVAALTQTVYINDIDRSPPPEPALIVAEQHQGGKVTERYVPSLSGKSYNYTQLGLSFLQDTQYKYSSEVVRIILIQLSLKAALKQWGNDAKMAVEAEAKQLYWRNSFKPVHWKELTEDRRIQILE
jgi:hypothetical protein